MLAKLQKRKQDDGFTLVELLVVIAILGILAGIVVFSVSGISDRGQSSACKTEKSVLQTAQEAYYAKNGAYAATDVALKTAGFLGSAPSWYASTGTGTAYSIAVTGAGTTAGCT
jgi:prepilin-type N-terminal cleavage/methylation domain-containing protein